MGTKFSMGKLAKVQEKKATMSLKEGFLSRKRCKDNKLSKGEDLVVISSSVLLTL